MWGTRNWGPGGAGWAEVYFPGECTRCTGSEHASKADISVIIIYRPAGSQVWEVCHWTKDQI